jgi:transposase
MMIDLLPEVMRSRNALEMLSPLARHKIQVLLEAGHSQRDVAERCEASLSTVRRVAEEGTVQQVDAAAETRRRRIGRPSQTDAMAEKIRDWLTTDPQVQTRELLRRAKLDGYTGKKSALYALVAGLRPKAATPVVLFEGLPGEFSQHDFGQVDVRFGDGTLKRVHFFASRLKYSRYAQVSIVNDEGVETLVRGLCRHFQVFGGVPLLAVFDRPKTVVLESGKGRAVRRFNAAFAQAVLEMGVGVEMCAARSGNQKGSVERIVGWVKSSFFKSRTFRDEADLLEQLVAWHHEVNVELPSRATGVIPETRRIEELPRLRPLGVFPENLALRIPVTVGPSGHVVLHGVRYAMPPETVHCPATLYLYEDRVRIETGRVSIVQRRRDKHEPIETPPELRAAKIAAVFGRRGKLYEQRQQLLELGPDALAFFTEIVHRRTYWKPVVERLHQLLLTHGEEAMRGAFEHAVATGHFDATTIERCLRQSNAPQGARSPARARGAQARAQLGLFSDRAVRAPRPGGAR